MESLAANSYRFSCNNESSSDESHSDSDGNESSWKRKQVSKPGRTIPVSAMDVDTLTSTTETVAPLPTTTRRKVNNVWCAVLQEQSLSDELGRFGMRRKPISLQERSCESYDFTLKAFDPRSDTDDNADDDMTCDKEDAIDKISEESANGKVACLKSKLKRKRYSVKEEEELKKAAKYIIKTLNEPKHSLIYRVVRTIGAKDALEILRMTEDVEESGGMMVLNQSRRRTPGGVFLQLLKNFPKVSKEQLDLIFAEEKKKFEMKRKQHHKKSKKKMLQKKAAQLKEKMEMGETSVNTPSTDANSLSTLFVIKDVNDDEQKKAVEVQDIQVKENNVTEEQLQDDDDDIEEGEIKD